MKQGLIFKGNVLFTSGVRRWKVEGMEGSVAMD